MWSSICLSAQNDTMQTQTSSFWRDINQSSNVDPAKRHYRIYAGSKMLKNMKRVRNCTQVRGAIGLWGQSLRIKLGAWDYLWVMGQGKKAGEARCMVPLLPPSTAQASLLINKRVLISTRRQFFCCLPSFFLVSVSMGGTTYGGNRHSRCKQTQGNGNTAPCCRLCVLRKQCRPSYYRIREHSFI